MSKKVTITKSYKDSYGDSPSYEISKDNKVVEYAAREENLKYAMMMITRVLLSAKNRQYASSYDSQVVSFIYSDDMELTLDYSTIGGKL